MSSVKAHKKLNTIHPAEIASAKYAGNPIPIDNPTSNANAYIMIVTLFKNGANIIPQSFWEIK